MRSTGTLKSWHDDRGFGFIAPADGGPDVFVHASALAAGMGRPVVGETLFYDLAPGADGRPRAAGVSRTWVATVRPRRTPVSARRRTGRPGRHPGGTIGLLALVVAGGIGYDQYIRRSAPAAALTPSGMARLETVSPSTPTPAPAFPSAPGRAVETASDTAQLHCDGRTSCPQMHSCAEATFFIQHCPGTKMDGDGDGIPCEQQWC